jgi:hypothetical protein
MLSVIGNLQGFSLLITKKRLRLRLRLRKHTAKFSNLPPITDFTDYRLQKRLRLRLRLRKIIAQISRMPPITDFY